MYSFGSYFYMYSYMIRLSAESTAFYHGKFKYEWTACAYFIYIHTPILLYASVYWLIGSGWRAYESYIGAPIFYPNYTTEIRSALMKSPRVQQVIRQLARDVLRDQGVLHPPQNFDGSSRGNNSS